MYVEYVCLFMRIEYMNINLDIYYMMIYDILYDI